MFHIESGKAQMDLILPAHFFELVLPMLASAPYAVGVYLFGYYRAVHPDLYTDEIKTQEQLADRLGISVDEVFASWKICEELGLIEKIPIDENRAGGYSIRYRDLRTIGQKRPSGSDSQELLLAYQREDYKSMYDQIEQALAYPLSSQDIKSIHQMINDYNINKALVVEAVLYTIFKKNSRSILLAMGVLRNWHLDGIRTVEDLEEMLRGKEKRYLEYKQILRAMGEYRGPTAPEKALMDVWLDEYHFDLEVVLEAIGKTTGIKTPNLNYVDGILKNQFKRVQQMTQEIPELLVSESQESDFEKRQQILERISFPRKSLRRDEMELLDRLSREFASSDVEVAYRYLKRNGKDTGLSSILAQLSGEEVPKERTQRITLKEVRIAEEKYRPQRTGQQREQREAASRAETKPNPIDALMKKRRQSAAQSRKTES